ncbi:MAG: dephospho-CoA kinase [Jannaschia sp.]
MIVVGLTGSIGMGKSTTAALFRDKGIPVWDADAAVHRLYAPGGSAALSLGTAFPGILAPDGAVDRKTLRARIAADPSILDRVNAIVHPLVAADRADFLSDRTDRFVVLDVPLLFETGLDTQVDRVAVVSTDPETQRARVLERGTMTTAEFEMILDRQMPDADKRARADYIIDTSTRAGAARDVDAMIADLTGAGP